MNVFIKTFILTSIIFSFGIWAGFTLDNIDSNASDERLEDIFIEVNSISLQKELYDKIGGNSFCQERLQGNLDFNDEIFKEGLLLEELEKRNKLGPDVIEKKERYALLQMQFWLNSIEIKETCNFNYSNLIYLYKHYSTPEDDIKQETQSSVLIELKNQCREKVMLIPLPADLGINTIDTIEKHYNITEYPSMIINEEKVFQGLQSLDSLKPKINC